MDSLRHLLITKKVVLFVFILLLLMMSLYIWFNPKKTQDIISLEQEPVAFYVDDGFQRNDEKLNIDFKVELEDLWCLKLHEDKALYYTGDFLLLYEGSCEVRITSIGGFVYSDEAYYQILNREKVKKIWNVLSPKKADMKLVK
jgi:hypothetical protein